MTKGILGRKVGMTQIFNDKGLAIPVTVIQAGPCHVLRLLTSERDGYEAVQLGFEDVPRNRATLAARGQVASLESGRSKKRQAAGMPSVAKANCEPKRFVREFRGKSSGLEVGAEIKVSVFDGVRCVDVTAQTKGRGFSGAMKRWGFKGLRATHGVKKVHRSLGGTGALAADRGGGRMKKGKKMPGRYGNERVTIRNINVAAMDVDNNLLMIHGAVPGPVGGYVIIRETNKVG